MRFYFIFLAVMLLLCSCCHCYSQYGNVWVFGNAAGVDFNFNPPLPIETKINTREGSASICDETGNLLFYTDGGTVWDRNHNPMPNGTDLAGVGFNITISTSQGALIVPWPGNPGFYYLFSLGSLESGSPGRLSYSVVDMALNNGLGDVTHGNKGRLVSTGLTEQMTAVYGNKCNIWLLVARHSSPGKVLAYNIDYNGIDSIAVVSEKIQGGGMYGGFIGSVDVSPDRTKVAFAHGNVVIYDFDANTGLLTGGYLLDPDFSLGHYGVAFSPDNSKLYTTTGGDLFQFDLSSNDTLSMTASKMLLGSGWAVKRGPDERMYVCSALNLDIIRFPNLAGAACEYISGGVALARGTNSILGLPNQAMMMANKETYTHTKQDTVVCADSFLLSARHLSGINYRWQDGTTGEHYSIDTSGTYWVSYQSYLTRCEEYADTFHIVFYKNKRIYSSSFLEAMCKADTFLVHPRAPVIYDGLWEDGSVEQERVITRPGTYWITYHTDSICTHYTDTFIVHYPEKDYNVAFSTDTLFCVGEMIKLNNTSPSVFTQFIWDFGDGNTSGLANPSHSFSRAGHYAVQLTGWITENCKDTFMQHIIIDSVFPVQFKMDRDQICVGESIRVYPVADDNVVELEWRYGVWDNMFTSDKTEQQHAFGKEGTYAVQLTGRNRICPETYYTDSVHVYALPVVVLGSDTGLCWTGQPILLANKASLPPGDYRYRWNTGDTGIALSVLHHGIYTLDIISEPLGCKGTESIVIAKNCFMDIPNAFTPNGDGENDYFFPRQLFSKSVATFTMQVFNRWGQLIFETKSISGRGWDGRFNGKDQPAGVYLYHISATIDGRLEHYEGNVTLMR